MCILPPIHYTCSVPRRTGDVMLEWWDESGKHCSEPLREIKDGPVIKYFNAQLQLFAQMCFYRQYLGISRVKEQLPIHVVLRYAMHAQETLFIDTHTLCSLVSNSFIDVWKMWSCLSASGPPSVGSCSASTWTRPLKRW